MPESAFQPERMLEVLQLHDVDFVLIGGYGTVVHGANYFTSDANVCPRPTRDNLTRLAAALRDMDARIRSDAVPDGLPFRADADFLLRMKMVNLTTTFGDLDISFEPAGFTTYEDLASRSDLYDVGAVRIHVANLDDIIQSKELADRAKDRAALPLLYALRDEIAKRDRS